MNDTYARILCNIDEEYQQHALHLLQWLAFSERPLQLEEVAEVLAIDINDKPRFDPQRRLADPHDVVEICSSLVTVTSGRQLEGRFAYDVGSDADSDAGSDAGSVICPIRTIVRLAHFSVREYLTSEVIIYGQAAKFSLQEIDCHVSLAKDCLAHLLHFDLPITCSKEEVFAEYPLLHYAAKHLTTHARIAEKRDSTLCTEFFLERGEAFFNWILLCDPDSAYYAHPMESRSSPLDFASSLYYASLVGLFEIVKTLCDMGADVNAVGGTFETALIATSWNDHTEIANLLLEKGAQVNFKSLHGTVLQIVTEKGSKEMLRLLLEYGADMNISGPPGTALQLASSHGYTEIVRLLLEHGANVNSSAPYSVPALQSASSNGHTETVQFLLEHGADANIAGPYNTALQLASSHGYTEIVRLLLEHGANVNSSAPYSVPALQSASSNGHTETVQFLLEHGADANIAGPYNTALQLASSHGYTEIVRLLLEHGANVNSSAPYSVPALQSASSNGHTETVQFLLEHGADVNIVGPFNHTALYTAIYAGHMEIAEMLSQNGGLIR